MIYFKTKIKEQKYQDGTVRKRINVPNFDLQHFPEIKDGGIEGEMEQVDIFRSCCKKWSNFRSKVWYLDELPEWIKVDDSRFLAEITVNTKEIE